MSAPVPPLLIHCAIADPGFAPLAAALTGAGMVLLPDRAVTPDAMPGMRAGGQWIAWQAADVAEDRIAAFRNGAADVVGPLMDMREAVLRIRRFAADRPSPQGSDIACGELTISATQPDVTRGGRPIALSQREHRLLLHLARYPETPFDRRALLRAVWRLDFDPGTNSVEVHIWRLRSKIDRDFAWPMLRTVKGAGYALYREPPL
ncbi:winged helix-turn-helix domain-containing protein [Sphingobium algorifonticola]|nr:response regulator transcription factor [Sphingobium algorifonticola]